MNSLAERIVIQHFIDRVREEAENQRVSQLELLQQLLIQWEKQYQKINIG
jgi:hypothetical protein